MKVDNIQSQMRKGVLEYCILLIISNRASYPSEIIGELRKAEVSVVEGTLYPLLTRLKNAGLLQYNWVESNAGPPRKYYALTESGLVFLEELRKTWAELAGSVTKLKDTKLYL